MREHVSLDAKVKMSYLVGIYFKAVLAALKVRKQKVVPCTVHDHRIMHGIVFERMSCAYTDAGCCFLSSR